MTSSGTVSTPQLFASNRLTVTNTSDFSDDLFLTKNWAGWSKLQVSNNSAAPDSGPELWLLGNQSARVFLERDGGTLQCELINDEALVQTKSLSTQLSLTTNQRNPGCLVIAGNTGNVVCNTSFTNLSDSRVKTEMAEADVAELQQLFDSVEAKQYKRPDERGPEAGLRLGRLRRNKVEEFDGHRPVERRHGDGYSRLLSSHQRAVGGAQGLPGPAGRALFGATSRCVQASHPRNLDQAPFGARSRCEQASSHPRNLEQAPFGATKLNGGIPKGTRPRPGGIEPAVSKLRSCRASSN